MSQIECPVCECMVDENDTYCGICTTCDEEIGRDRQAAEAEAAQEFLAQQRWARAEMEREREVCGAGMPF